MFAFSSGNGRKQMCCRHPAGGKQQSTGLLHLDGSNLSVLDFSKIKCTAYAVHFILEVPARFELANNGFADRGLTTWLRYHMK